MTWLRIVYWGCSAATAGSAFVAARYWYLSSRPNPTPHEFPVASITDNPELHVLGAQVDIGSIQAVLFESSRLNKKAAIWSGISAFLAGVTSLLGVL